MTFQEIRQAIADKIVGQGNQIDIGGVLANILNGLLDLIGNAHAVIIQSTANTTAGGYQVPVLTPEDVTHAYNAVTSGRGAIIVDKDEVMHAFVNQADALNGELSIGILFYSYMLLTYTLTDNAVTITTTPIE